MRDYVIGLGSNLGSRRATLETAVERLSVCGTIRARSCVYASEPVGPPQPDYLNAGVRLRSALSPESLLERLLRIEAELGRSRADEVRWGPRTLDLDILWAGAPHTSPSLTIPHPRLRQRWFALAPLLDVAPELEPEYGPALQALGGRRPGRLSAWGTPPEVEVRQDAHGWTLRARAPELPDALADALSELLRQVGPARVATAQAAYAIPIEARAPGAASEALVRAALDAAGEGFAVARAVVCELDADRGRARLLGTRVPRRVPGFAPRAVRVRCARDELRIEVELDEP